MKRKLKNSGVFRRVFFPNRRELLKSGLRNAWDVSKFPLRRVQSTTPADKLFFEKIGVMPNSRVLVVGGGYGDWAKKLAEKTIVHYSDVSQAMVDFARKKAKNIKLFGKGDAFLLPQLERKYDWSFYYEPMPFLDSALPISLVRSLLNKQGAKIVFYFCREASISPTKIIAKKIAKAYKADFVLEEIDLNARPLGLQTFAVLTLRTNSFARRNAKLDLIVMKELDKGGITIDDLLAAKRIRDLGVSAEEIKMSLGRINLVSGEMFSPGRMQKRIKIK